MRKPRKKRSVMGWELRRQCRSPCLDRWAPLSISSEEWMKGVTRQMGCIPSDTGIGFG